MRDSPPGGSSVRTGVRFAGVVLAFVAGVASSALAQHRERFSVEVEGGPVWQTRNGVRVPNDGGSEFSLVDTIGKGPDAAFRVDVGFDPWEKHGFRVVIAPLQIEGRGTFDDEVSFAGETFEEGVPTDARSSTRRRRSRIGGPSRKPS